MTKRNRVSDNDIMTANAAGMVAGDERADLRANPFTNKYLRDAWNDGWLFSARRRESELRERLALALLKSRPPTIPGTNAIPDEPTRLVWYRCASEIAEVVCRGEGADKDRVNAMRFFDVAGVSD